MKTKPEKEMTVLEAIIVLAILFFISLFLYSEYSTCDKDNGILVRGLITFECIKK